MNSSNSINISSGDGLEFRSCSLNQDGISRYGRQLILRGWGVEAQQRLSTARILIVGAGGLGCPCALYLASAGVGSLGICDYDSIERSNLHRQIAHQDQAVGTSKAESLVRACRDLNPTVAYQLHQERFEIANAKQLLRQYDMVVDATDNVPTRYLINDSAMACGVPVVSGAALGFEGQLSVYGLDGGPCYRCVFRQPPPPGLVGSCNNAGVLGPLPGVIGTLQALEALKVAGGVGEPLRQRMLIFDGLRMTSRVVKLRERDEACPACGVDALPLRPIDDFSQCSSATVSRADEGLQISVHELAELRRRKLPHLLLDVRAENQFVICSLDASTSMPFDELCRQVESDSFNLPAESDKPGALICVICRRGVMSLRGAKLLAPLLAAAGDARAVRSVSGGLTAWQRDIDPNFPLY